MEFLKKGKKTIAIIMTLVVVLTGMYICAQRHGDVMWTSAPDFAISAGQAILVDGDTGRVGCIPVVRLPFGICAEE